MKLAPSDVLTLERFLEQYPWSAEDLRLGTPYEWFWQYEVDAPVSALWPLLVDTSRFNRAMGLGSMNFEERDGELRGTAVNGGFRQEWVEVPWTWTHEREVVAERRYSRGFAHVVRAIYVLQELIPGERARVYVYFGWIPRGLLGRLMLWLGEGMLRRGYGRVLNELVRESAEARPVVYQLPASTDDAARQRLAALRQELVQQRQPGALVDRLVEYLTTADELDLYRIQVRRLAREWGVDERELLKVSLHATRAGMLEMTWDVVCPHCRGVRDEARSVSALPAASYCDVCEIEFGTGEENSIEITFHVHPSIRDIPKVYFCSAEPAKKSHIKVQQTLAPGERKRIEPRLRAGVYRMRLKDEKTSRTIEVSDAAGARELAWAASDDDASRLVAPHPDIALRNDSDAPQTFIIEDSRWPDHALRPADLFVCREFHDLFSQEYVSDGVQLAVGRQTIVFTDMVGSTRFYNQRGDPEAFVEVRRHFEEIEAIVDEQGGVLVKTIGDATMVVFTEPIAAVRACGAIQRCFHAARDDSPIRVRISLHVGTCIAVKLNSNIDFFGSSVNLASKLQACAESGQVAMSRAVYEDAAVRAFLDERQAALKEFVFEVKALDEPVDVVRWDVWVEPSAENSLSGFYIRPGRAP